MPGRRGAPAHREPEVLWPCFYGIDFASRGELIAAKYSLPEITKMLDVDSLHYLSIDGLLRSVMQSDSYCLACFDGNYPMPKPNPLHADAFLPDYEPTWNND